MRKEIKILLIATLSFIIGLYIANNYMAFNYGEHNNSGSNEYNQNDDYQDLINNNGGTHLQFILDLPHVAIQMIQKIIDIFQK